MAGPLDGIIAKRVDRPYASGERDSMVKIKNLRTADCVVGGFRYGSKNRPKECTLSQVQRESESPLTLLD